MRKLVVGEFISLDGVTQAPGGKDEDTEGGFAHGGWTWPYWHDDIGATIFDVMQECDAYLYGRKTWQIHGEAFEPMEPGEPMVDGLNATAKYVVSTTLDSAAAWRNSTLINPTTGDDVATAVRKLKEQPGKTIYVDGSSVLVHTLSEHGLVDEYSLLVYPIVLGSGKKLFADGWHAEMDLIESRTYPTGVTLMRLRPKV
jgi:dihydrofolate reductase